MAKRKRHRIVVDASVATASGESHDFVSIACRGFLEEFRKGPSRLVIYSEIRQEWLRHPSAFAVEWLAAMVASKRVDDIQLADQPKLRELLNSIALSITEKRNWAKDFHLICASLQADKSIASRDRKAEAVFRKLAASVQTLHKIEWFDPERHAAHTQPWLQGKNPQKRQFCLKP